MSFSDMSGPADGPLTPDICSHDKAFAQLNSTLYAFYTFTNEQCMWAAAKKKKQPAEHENAFKAPG